MATVVGQASAAATSVAIPAHAVGDLIIVAARGTAAAPVKPAAGGTVPAWDTLQSAVANTLGLTVVAFVATATNTTTGTFTSATHICVLVLRPAALKKLQTSAARSSVGNGNNTQTIIYPALTLNNGGGAATSLGVRVGTRGVADSEVGTAIPSGWTNQSIQPAGASALMAVHTRLALAANPTADSVTTAGTNAAYRAVTVEVEEVALGSTQAMVGATVGVAAVAVAMTVLPPPITFAIDLATNQPYAGEHTVGEFLAGTEPLLAIDLFIERLDFLEGGISGQAQVGAGLTVERSLAASIAGVGAVTAQQSQARGVAVSIASTGTVTAQQGVTRGLAAAVMGSGSVAADTSIGNTISFGCAVVGSGVVTPQVGRVYALGSTVVGSGAVSAQTVEERTLEVGVTGIGVVAPSLTVTNASFVNLDVAVTGQAGVTPALARVVSLGVSVAGAAAIAAQTVPLRGLAVTLTRQGAVTAQATTSTPLAANIARAAVVAPSLTVTAPVGGPVDLGPVTITRAAAVSANLTRVGLTVDFACSLGLPLAGQKLAGTFLVGSGPGATVEAQMGPVVTSFVANIVGKATVLGSERGQRDLVATISRAGAVSAQMLVTRGLGATIARAAVLDIDGRVIRIVRLECEIKVIPHIVGQYLAGEQVVGGTGPRATIEAYTTIRGPFAIAIQGKASIDSLLRPSIPFSSAITGKAEIVTESRPSLPFSVAIAGRANVSPYHVTSLVLQTAFAGKAAIKAKLNLDWLVPTEPSGIILYPTDEESWILVPTTNGNATLIPSTPESVILDPTDEEDVLLVPTTERTM